MCNEARRCTPNDDTQPVLNTGCPIKTRWRATRRRFPGQATGPNLALPLPPKRLGVRRAKPWTRNLYRILGIPILRFTLRLGGPNLPRWYPLRIVGFVSIKNASVVAPADQQAANASGKNDNPRALARSRNASSSSGRTPKRRRSSERLSLGSPVCSDLETWRSVVSGTPCHRASEDHSSLVKPLRGPKARPPEAPRPG